MSKMSSVNSLMLFSLLICANNCRSQVVQFGTCADVTTVAYFDLERFLGVWYEIQRFPNWYENYGHCAYKRIQACGRHIEIQHAFVRDEIEYVLHVNSSYVPGNEAVFVILENSVDPVGIPLSVIATNYDDYAVVYGCRYSEEQNIKYVSAWVLSRSRTLSQAFLEEAHDAIDATASTAYLERVIQSEVRCSHYWTAHVQAENNTRTELAAILANVLH